jgi:glycosyltransferase involved in cell wall biosynthesis
MKVQTLVTTINKSDDEILALVKHNNLRGDVIVGCQCGSEGIVKVEVDEYTRVTIVHQSTIGLSINRNCIFKYSTADVISFADDDVVFSKDYLSVVSDSFAENPKADAIRFNCVSTYEKRPIKQIHAHKKLHFLDVKSLGILCIFFKRKSVSSINLFFDTDLGSGTIINHGEDGVFLHTYLKTKTMVQDPKVLATVQEEQSTWWGRDIHRDVYSHGYIYQRLFGWKAALFGFVFITKHRFSLFRGVKLRSLFRWFLDGVRDGKTKMPHYDKAESGKVNL